MNKVITIKEPFPLKTLRWVYPKIERILPSLAHKIAFNLFFSPFRFTRPKRELKAFESAKVNIVKVNNKNVQLYEWGIKRNPIIVMVHGWSGRGTQFFKFIAPLIAEGYRVITFDAPAHGLSQGKITNIKEFTDVLSYIETNIGTIKVGIGHSFGGVSLIYAKKLGLQLDNIVMISSPTVGEDILTSFRNKIGASPETSLALRNLVAKNFQIDFEGLTACALVANMPIKNLLIIHDRNDSEVPYTNAEALKKASSRAELILTNNLGHTRILRDDKVVETVVKFAIK